MIIYKISGKMLLFNGDKHMNPTESELMKGYRADQLRNWSLEEKVALAAKMHSLYTEHDVCWNDIARRFGFSSAANAGAFRKKYM